MQNPIFLINHAARAVSRWAPVRLTLRQTLAVALGDPTCQACHSVVDPPGLAFELFDPIGRTRATDNGLPVDTSNLRVNVSSTFQQADTVLVNGPVDLANALALAPGAQECHARKWLAFVLGRDLQEGDEASVKTTVAKFSASGHVLKELIVAALTSDTFLAPPN